MGPSGKLPSNILAKEFCEIVPLFTKVVIPVVGESPPGNMDFSRWPGFFIFPESKGGRNSGLRKFGVVSGKR